MLWGGVCSERNLRIANIQRQKTAASDKPVAMIETGTNSGNGIRLRSRIRLEGRKSSAREEKVEGDSGPLMDTLGVSHANPNTLLKHVEEGAMRGSNDKVNGDRYGDGH